MRIILGLVFLLLTIASCSNPPKACITLDQESIAVGTQVTFSSCSEKALSYVWTISGPVGATENNIQWAEESFTRAFAIPGDYVAELTVYKKYSWGGQSDVTTSYFTVN